jgi:hypothetical protein
MSGRRNLRLQPKNAFSPVQRSDLKRAAKGRFRTTDPRRPAWNGEAAARQKGTRNAGAGQGTRKSDVKVTVTLVPEPGDAVDLAARDLQTPRFYSTGAIYGAATGSHQDIEKDFVNTLRLSAALAALTLTASTTCAAVIDFSNALGPSGRYTSEAYYQGMLGGQAMTAAQQAFSDQEDQLRLLGFLSELGGDMALGQIFYHIAYGITPPPPPSALDLASGGSDLPPPSITPSPPSITPSSLVTGASDVGDTGAGLTLTTPVITGVDPATAVPEPSTWAMMLLGFVGLGFAGYRASRRGVAAA